MDGESDNEGGRLWVGQRPADGRDRLNAWRVFVWALGSLRERCVWQPRHGDGRCDRADRRPPRNQPSANVKRYNRTASAPKPGYIGKLGKPQNPLARGVFGNPCRLRGLFRQAAPMDVPGQFAFASWPASARRDAREERCAVYSQSGIFCGGALLAGGAASVRGGRGSKTTRCR